MRRYCLFCFATMPEKGNRCECCHQTTHPLDYRLFWNRNPRIVNIEQTIKILTVVLMGLCILLLFGTVGPISATGFGAGWFFLLPLLPAVGIWNTASTLTRAQPYFQPQIFWIAVFVLVGVLLAFVNLYLVTMPAVCILGVMLATRDLRRWKKRLIAGTG